MPNAGRSRSGCHHDWLSRYQATVAFMASGNGTSGAQPSFFWSLLESRR
jgi:hypothetical protein